MGSLILPFAWVNIRRCFPSSILWCSHSQLLFPLGRTRLSSGKITLRQNSMSYGENFNISFIRNTCVKYKSQSALLFAFNLPKPSNYSTGDMEKYLYALFSIFLESLRYLIQIFWSVVPDQLYRGPICRQLEVCNCLAFLIRHGIFLSPISQSIYKTQSICISSNVFPIWTLDVHAHFLEGVIWKFLLYRGGACFLCSALRLAH